MVRTALVRRVCLEGMDADVTTYREIKGHLRAAGKAAARGETVVVDGVEVGLGGVVDRTGTQGTRSQDATIDLEAVLQGMFSPIAAAAHAGAAPSAATPPGWYPDPEAPTTAWRWWDGHAWTAHASGPGGHPR